MIRPCAATATEPLGLSATDPAAARAVTWPEGGAHGHGQVTGARLSWAGEVGVWALFAVLLGSVEGGVVSLLIKSLYRGTVSPVALDTLVGLLVGSANLAHIAGLGWAWLARGREPSRLLVQLQVLCALCLGLVAAAPRTSSGLAMMVAGALGARLVWSGMMTMRTSVWRAHHGRAERARLGGTVVALHYLVVAATSAAAGAVLGKHLASVRWLHLLAAVLGLVGASLYHVLERRGLAAASRTRDSDPAPSDNGQWTATSCFRILRDDSLFRRYLASFFVLDTGVMMAVAPLLLFLHDRSGLPNLVQTLLIATVPTIVVPLTMPLFARRLSRVHVARFRAFQSWFSVGAVALFAAGAATSTPLCLWLGSILLGAGYAGGSICWHLGIHDFSTPERAPDYMALNVALTGVRGLFAPALGVGLYRLVESAYPGLGALALVAALAVTAAGALGFVSLARDPSIPLDVHR